MRKRKEYSNMKIGSLINCKKALSKTQRASGQQVLLCPRSSKARVTIHPNDRPHSTNKNITIFSRVWIYKGTRFWAKTATQSIIRRLNFGKQNWKTRSVSVCGNLILRSSRVHLPKKLKSRRNRSHPWGSSRLSCHRDARLTLAVLSLPRSRWWKSGSNSLCKLWMKFLHRETFRNPATSTSCTPSCSLHGETSPW